MAFHEGEEQMTTQFLRGIHLQERVHEQAETLVVDILKQPRQIMLLERSGRRQHHYAMKRQHEENQARQGAVICDL
jgi:sugar diacid utilization regulator